MAAIGFEPHASAALELVVVVVSLAVGSVGALLALRTRAARHADRIVLQSVREREAAFAEAACRLTSAARDSPGAVRNEIAAAVRAAAPAADGILLYEEHDGALRCVVAFGERFAFFSGTSVALDDSAAMPARALHARHRVTLADDGVRALHPADTSAVAIPLALEARRRCVLAVASQRELTADAVDRIVTLAAQASPAYLIALDREQDRYEAEYDGLTGLLTPRAFRQSLTALLERMQRVPTARLGLLFVDTDHFKRWNDRLGHAAGDALLRDLATVLRAAAAHGDLVGRNGGDEFCIVFADADKSTAIERAETLRRRIAALNARARPHAPAYDDLPITASIGVAAFPTDAATASDLLERADAAMYHSKVTGRDGVSYCAGGSFVRLGQQPSSERPSSSLVSEFPTIL